MDLLNLLTKLQAIDSSVQEAKELKGGQKELDKDDDGDIDGDDFAHMRKQKNEDIFNVLKGLKAIQEAEGKCDDCGEVHEGSCSKSKMKEETLDEAKCPKCGMDPCKCNHKKVDECGDMEMSPLTDPDAGYDMAPMAAMAQQAEPEMAAEPAEEKPRFTLSIQNGDSNLSMTTDIPDEIIHVMKLAGVKGKPEVKPAKPEQGEEKEVEESWGNTPSATNEKEPRAYGDIRDWGLPGTAKAKTHPVPAKQGDNPLGETAMFEEYKKFKSGK